MCSGYTCDSYEWTFPYRDNMDKFQKSKVLNLWVKWTIKTKIYNAVIATSSDQAHIKIFCHTKSRLILPLLSIIIEY